MMQMVSIQDISLNWLLPTLLLSGILCGCVNYTICYFRKPVSTLELLKCIFAGIFFCSLLMLCVLFIIKWTHCHRIIGKLELMAFGLACILASVVVTVARFWLEVSFSVFARRNARRNIF